MSARAGLVLLLACTGCSAVCKGPGCEEDWPATRVVVHRGDTLGVGERDARSDADGAWIGTVVEGAGWSIAAHDGLLVFGQPEAGRVVTVPDRRTSGPVTPIATWTDADGAGFGAAVAVVAAGPGAFDLWASAPEHDEARGAVRLFPSVNRVDPGEVDAEAARLVVVGGSPGDRLGDRLVACGDLSGDGLPDLVTTAPWFAANEALVGVPALAGAVFLLRSERFTQREGQVLPWELGPAWWGEQTGDGAGAALACDRDLTGDGVVDLAIGAPWYDDASGRVYVIAGGELPPTGPLDLVAARILDAPAAGSWYGSALAALNLDGVPPAELAIGAPGFDGGRGRVHLYEGSDGPSVRQLATIAADPERGDAADHVGRWLADGDLDGDGVGDLIVGAPDLVAGVNGFDAGRAWAWFGSGSPRWSRGFAVTSADLTLTGDQPFQRVGRAPLVVDLDGDGLDDLVLPTRAPAP